MPFDSNGVFSRVMNWTQDQQDGIAIECGRHDDEDDNFANGFNNCFCRDGRAAATGNFNMGNHKIQNLAAGTATTDAVNKGQIDNITTNMVKLSGNQTIAGIKTFSATISGSINGNAATVTNGVYTTGNQTINGEKTFNDRPNFVKYIYSGTTEVNSGISAQKTNVTKGTTPDNNYNNRVLLQSKDGMTANQRLASLDLFYTTNNETSAVLSAYKPEFNSTTRAAIGVYYPASGSPYTYAPNPSLSSDASGYTGQIVTVGYLEGNSSGVVHKTGNETIADTKTFSSSPIVPTAATTDNSTKAASTAFVKTAISVLLSNLYPVGSLYITTNNSATCPLASLISGSSWSLVAANKALWTSNRNANTTIEAGLPNITGKLNNTMWQIGRNISGAFEEQDYGVGGIGSGTNGGAWNVNFDASRSNSIYGNSSTVQPPAYCVNVWRRTA
jgi:hypothetical protein